MSSYVCTHEKKVYCKMTPDCPHKSPKVTVGYAKCKYTSYPTPAPPSNRGTTGESTRWPQCTCEEILLEERLEEL